MELNRYEARYLQVFGEVNHLTGTALTEACNELWYLARKIQQSVPRYDWFALYRRAGLSFPITTVRDELQA